MSTAAPVAAPVAAAAAAPVAAAAPTHLPARSPCCARLLAEIAAVFDATPEEVERRLAAPKCARVYQRASGAYGKGDRCRLPVLSEGHVFCEAHHKQAPRNTNVVTLGKETRKKLKYVPSVGLLECASAQLPDGATRTLTLVQGSTAALAGFLALPEGEQRLRLRW